MKKIIFIGLISLLLLCNISNAALLFKMDVAYTTTTEITIEGTVELQGYVGDITAVPVTFDFVDPNTLYSSETKVVNLNADGSFSFTTFLKGTYNIAAKAPTWLRQEQINIDITSGATVHFSLINGDADGNNSVGFMDFNVVVNHFGFVEGQSNWYPPADLNGDGSVGFNDVNIVAQNFGEIGSEIRERIAGVYVDPARPDNTGDGLTPATAKKTIAAAIAAIGDGESILLMDGTYDATTQGATWYINLNQAKSMTFLPADGHGPITLNTAWTGGGSRAIYCRVDASMQQIEFHNLTINGIAATFLDMVASSVVLKFNGVTASMGSGNVLINDGSTGRLEVDDSNLTSTNANMFDVRGGNLYVRNTILNGKRLIYVRYTAKNLVLEDCPEITCEEGVYIAATTAGTSVNARIKGNKNVTITPVNNDAHFVRARHDSNCSSLIIENNDITVADHAQSVFDAIKLHRLSPYPSEPILFNLIIRNNKIVSLRPNFGGASAGILIGASVSMARSRTTRLSDISIRLKFVAATSVRFWTMCFTA